MSTEALKEYEPILIRRASQLVQELNTRAGTIDIAAWLSYFA